MRTVVPAPGAEAMAIVWPSFRKDAAAEIQADAGRALVRAAVAAGIALFKHARQILRRDADARVADAERFRRLERDRTPPPLRVYLRALESTCSMTNSSHFSSVMTLTFSGV